MQYFFIKNIALCETRVLGVSPKYAFLLAGVKAHCLLNHCGRFSRLLPSEKKSPCRLRRSKLSSYEIANYLTGSLVSFTFVRTGTASSSLVRSAICFSIAVSRSSGRFMDGWRVKVKPISFRSCAFCLVPITSRQTSS